MGEVGSDLMVWDPEFLFSSYFMHIHMHMNSVRCDKPSLLFSQHFLLDILNI